MAIKKIKTYEQACKVLNQDPTLPEFPALSEAERKAAIAHYKLIIIVQALNEGWKPDWANWDQNKYWPWFAFQGGRFVFYYVSYYFAYSGLGSRLCFKSRALAEYAGKTFLDLYNDYYLTE